MPRALLSCGRHFGPPNQTPSSFHCPLCDARRWADPPDICGQPLSAPVLLVTDRAMVADALGALKPLDKDELLTITLLQDMQEARAPPAGLPRPRAARRRL